MTAPTINGPKTARPAIPGQRTDSDPLETTTGDRSEEITPEISAEDLDAQSPAADLVRVYLNGIGKTALLTAAQEVDLAKRIEAGVFAKHVLDTHSELDKQYPPTCGPSCATASARATTCSRPTCGWS
jgi:RNA polymerase nonessential primary-like sigma factor